MSEIGLAIVKFIEVCVEQIKEIMKYFIDVCSRFWEKLKNKFKLIEKTIKRKKETVTFNKRNTQVKVIKSQVLINKPRVNVIRNNC